MAIEPKTPPTSPRWGIGIKLVVSITLAAIFFALVIRFGSIIGPLLITGIFAYLIHPLAASLSRRLHMRWPVAVTLIYLVLLLIVIGLLTGGGVALAPQVVSLVELIRQFFNDLPQNLAQLSATTVQLGGYQIDLSQYGLTDLANQILGVVKPLLGEVGTLVGKFAGGAAEVIGWLFFVLLVSYFILVESSSNPQGDYELHLPGYGDDIQRMTSELSRIWNAFLRGQFWVILLAIAIYSVVLSILGVRYAIGLALLAGIARFVPYVGAWVTWITLALVSYFQAAHPFGGTALVYTAVVVVIALIVDTLLDNMVATRILARALKIHPAAVLIAAIVLANLIGLVGVVLASPMVATLKLIFRYIKRKLLDQDPWEGLEEEEAKPLPEVRLVRWIKRGYYGVMRMIRKTRGEKKKA
jgi:predicted PurR-regulated permease PerM